MMNKRILGCVLMVMLVVSAKAQVKAFEVNDDWVQKIKNAAPEKAEVTPTEDLKVLVFDLITGFNHWDTPHIDEVIKALGEKSGAFEVEVSSDIYKFERKNLKNYHAVVLNNNCSVGPRRNMFLDVLDQDEGLSVSEKLKTAKRLEANLIKFVKKGKGLMVVHGAITMLNNSMAFSDVVGGSFNYHPAQQDVPLEMVDANHPLVKAFDGKTFVHFDEPYLFKNAYQKKNFRPLLYIDTSKLTVKKEIDERFKYVSWIKRHGKGRVFYSSPSHNAQSFEDRRLLQFFLDGLQYVLGDLNCDDSPGGFK
jgi:type 1 glutamine amidotransferase